MADKFKFELNRDGVKQLMQSPEMMAVCEAYARRAQSTLGNGYEVSTMTGKTRVNAQISAVTYKARKENSENNTILKSLRG
jgi:hypothetical protein